MKTAGLVFVFLGIAVLGLGGWLFYAGYDLTQPAGQLWYTIDASSLNLVQAIVQRYIFARLWDGAFVPYLLLPGWRALAFLAAGLFVIGALFLFAARRRRRYGFRR